MNDLIDRVARVARPVLGALGVFWMLIGVWAFAAPHSFFDVLAEYEPYNRHFIHDIGTMQIGLGAGALAAALTLRPVVSGLVGLTGFQVAHVLSHIIDRDLGGRPWFDIPNLSLAALVGIVLLYALVRRGQDPARGT